MIKYPRQTPWVKTFKPQFADDVRAYRKLQTMRPWPKRGCKDVPLVGDMIDARTWSGRPYNSPQVHLCFGKITEVKRVVVTPGEVQLSATHGDQLHGIMHPHEMEAFAIRDGFPTWDALIAWFRREYGKRAFPFHGYVIQWEPETVIPARMSATPTPDGYRIE